MALEVRVVDGAAEPERVVYAQVFEDPEVLKRLILTLNKAPRRRRRKGERVPTATQ